MNDVAQSGFYTDERHWVGGVGDSTMLSPEMTPILFILAAPFPPLTLRGA